MNEAYDNPAGFPIVTILQTTKSIGYITVNIGSVTEQSVVMTWQS